MAHEPSDVFANFWIDGEWRETYDGVDLSHRVRGGDSIRISRGGNDQFSSITSMSCAFTLNNGDNFFTDDDPNTPLYRKFGQNTLCRFGVRNARDLDLFAQFSDLPIESSGERIYTADKASLDITGDLDVRWEMDMRVTRDISHLIGGKYVTTGNQRSWLVSALNDGRISIRHSTDGTSSALSIQSSTVRIVNEQEGRRAYRLTLDVDDGAGNRVYTWYTSDSIDGTWTQVDTATVAGTTSIYSSTADLTIGAANGGLVTITNAYPFAGKIYRFQVRDGINGTLVADFDPNADAALGETTWADTCASPNTWIIKTDDTGALPAIRLGSDNVRFTGEIQTRPDDWDLSGVDRFQTLAASGILSRYASNRAPLQSVERRYWTRQPGIVGFWPCEDGGEATQVSSALDAGIPGVIGGDVSFGSTTGFGGTAGAITLNSAGSSTADFYATPYTGTGAWGFVFYFKIDETTPASEQVLVNIYPQGSNVARWAFQIGLTTYRWTAFSGTGATLDTNSSTFGSDASPIGNWVAMSMTFKQEGGNIRWETSWHRVGSTTTYTHFGGGETFAGTVGIMRRMYFVPTDSNFDNIQIAHVVMFGYEYEIGTDEFAAISRGFAGETFGQRWARLLTEEGIGYEWVGLLADTEQCGAQPTETLYNILSAGADLDGGLITEARDALRTLRYVTGKALGNRKRLELSYTSSHLADTPRPADAARYTVNDFTASRDGGGSARYEATDTRRKNVREPDDASPGVGRYERSGSYNAYNDARMLYIASFRVFLGTWEERYIPNMVIGTHRAEIASDTSLLAAITSQDIGDPMSIVDTAGSPMPPNDVNSVCTGYAETIKNMTRDFVFSTIPRGPYDTPVLESKSDTYDPRLDVEDTESVLDGAIDATATSIDIKTLKTATVPQWVDDAGYPDDIGGGETIDIDISGERVTVTSITAPTSDATHNYQTFTVTRSVNSVVKSHADETPVRLFTPSYLGRI